MFLDAEMAECQVCDGCKIALTHDKDGGFLQSRCPSCAQPSSGERSWAAAALDLKRLSISAFSLSLKPSISLPGVINGDVAAGTLLATQVCYEFDDRQKCAAVLASMPVLCPGKKQYQLQRNVMSLNEHLKGHSMTPTSNGGGLPRSKSFTGVLGHKRSTSSASAEGCVQESEVGVRTTWGPTLGHSFNSPSVFRRHLTLSGHSKLPKAPRTARASVMFEKISKGLRDCLAVTEDDVINLRRSAERLSTHSQQQLKAAERYIKRLEYQLSKLEELHEQYTVQQKLREGMRTMACAYVSSSGREKDAALNSVKASYRESTEVMCAIEVQLEQMMGTLHFQMKGIQGFARLCSGDVFEITIKHSTQKWKSRGRVLKNGQQTWDSPHATFKALLGEVLYIKAVEVKGLGKQVLLGNKFCETRELFCAHPQIMTINLNPSGSLKLNVVITWNPLDGNIEEVMRAHLNSTGSQPPVNTRQRNVGPAPVPTRVSSMLCPGEKPRYFFGREHLQKYPSHDSLSPRVRNSIPDSNKCHDNHSDGDRDPELSSHLRRANSVECYSDDLASADRESTLEGISVLEAVHNLSSCLEDIQGQYPELHNLEVQVCELEQMLGVGEKRSRRGSHSSDMSTSIESALECFDFLNTETDDDEDMDWIQDRFSINEKDEMDPGMTAKTSDSGIGSLTHHTTAEQALEARLSPRGKSPSSLSSGENQIDLALVIHLSYCQHLVESLGSFGPLKCKEIYALEKLRRQIPILERLISLTSSCKEERKDVIAVEELHVNSELRQVWSRCAEHRHQLCIPAHTMLPRLHEVCQRQLMNRQPNTVSSVAKLLIARVVDMPRFDLEALVTIYQVRNYFETETQLSFEKHVQELAEEVQQTEVLQSHDVPAILDAIRRMLGSVPSPNCLRTMSQLLLVPHQNIQQAVKAYLTDINGATTLRMKVLTVFIEALESDSSLVRQGACLALLCLRASECIDQLAYLYQTDECTNVRSTAKEALLSFGDEGRRAYEQSQLSSLGFHGLGVK